MKLFSFKPFASKGFGGLHTRFKKYGNKMKSNLAFLANELRTIRYLIKDYFNTYNISNTDFINVILFIFPFLIFILTVLSLINETEFTPATIIPFFSFRNFVKLDKNSRYKRFVLFINDEFIWNVFKRNAFRLKINFRPIASQIIKIIHTCDFFKGNKTSIECTTIYRHKRDEFYGDLFDLKINLKNINKRQIDALCLALEMSQHKLHFKEESELFKELIQCYVKFEEVFYEKRRANIPKPTKKTRK